MTERDGDGLEQVHPLTRAEWREWLLANHAVARGVWLVYFKQSSGKPRVAYGDAVEEALCFGWIDSRPNTIDEERYMQLFSPRNAGSPWSRLNKQRIDRLLAANLVAPAGLRVIEAARVDGSWDAYDAIEDLTVPDDLATALAEQGTAAATFAAFSDSAKKQLLWWVASAKRDATRRARIERLVVSAEQGVNPLQYQRKPR